MYMSSCFCALLKMRHGNQPPSTHATHAYRSLNTKSYAALCATSSSVNNPERNPSPVRSSRPYNSSCIAPGNVHPSNNIVDTKTITHRQSFLFSKAFTAQQKASGANQEPHRIIKYIVPLKQTSVKQELQNLNYR